MERSHWSFRKEVSLLGSEGKARASCSQNGQERLQATRRKVLESLLPADLPEGAQEARQLPSQLPWVLEEKPREMEDHVCKGSQSLKIWPRATRLVMTERKAIRKERKKILMLEKDHRLLSSCFALNISQRSKVNAQACLSEILRGNWVRCGLSNLSKINNRMSGEQLS